MKKIVIYTSIFGPYDGLLPQTKFPNIDYICFTDQPFKSKTWKVVNVPTIYDDSTRNSRRIKLQPHKFLPEYDISIFIDGNYLVLKDINKLIEEELASRKMLIFDHAQAQDSRNCVYDEFQAIMALGNETGSFKDNPEVMRNQIERYKKEGYPEKNGLIFSAVLIRRHNDPEVIKLMDSWWSELSNNSKRDQLSFDYVAWKNNFNFHVIDGDLRKHEYFRRIGKHQTNYRKKYIKHKLKTLFSVAKYIKK